MVVSLFHGFCSAELGVNSDRPALLGSELGSVTRRMRDPNVGSLIIDPAGPIGGGVSGYGSTRRSVRAQYCCGPHELLGAGSGGALLAACAHASAPKLNTVLHTSRCFMAKVDVPSRT